MQMTDILDIADIVWSPWRDFFLFLGILFILFLVLMLLWIVWRLYQKYKLKTEKLLSPDQKVRVALDKLKKKKLLESGEFKKYYYFISEIFRGYLEGRYHYPALEKTTQELSQDLKIQSNLDEVLYMEVISFLQELDLVKFASHKPSLDESLKLEERILSFVTKTVPSPQSLS